MSSEEKLRWGVIGACGIARRRTIPEGIVPASNAGLEAVMDVNREGVRAVAESCGSKAYDTIDQLLGDKAVDAVYVATPNHLHMEHVLAAARAKKHVLCEKPLALSAPDICKMISACRQAGVLLGVGFMMRFNVYHQKIRDMIRDGTLGAPVMARGQMTSWHPPSQAAWRHVPEQGGGGCVTDVASHVVDVLEMFFGRTRSVFCQCFNRVHDSAVEDTALLQLVFDSGAAGMIDVSFAVPGLAGEYVLEVYGSKGAIKGKYSLSQKPGGEFRICLIEEEGVATTERTYESGYKPLELEPRNTYQAEIEAFSRAVLEGGPAPVSAEDGLWNHVVVEAAYESARTGRPIEPRINP